MVSTVVLVGLMGSGKTTVGRRLARRLDRPFADADEVAVERAGCSISEVFATQGEAAFRVLESEVLAELLDGEPSVVAAGGGVVVVEANRERLRRPEVTVVWLDGSPSFLASRAEAKASRPLLTAGDDPRAVLERLACRARLVVRGGGRHPRRHRAVPCRRGQGEAGVGRPPRRARAGPRGSGSVIRVEVPLGDRAYPVLIGSGARAAVADLLPPQAGRVAIVTQLGIGFDVDVGREHRVFTVPDGEAAKSLSTVESLCRQWAGWGLTRSDAVVAVGGGAITDLGGFAAAVYHRGLPVVHVATTLLGMVDAAIGGKTGVNLPEGKNLVGAFWQPSGVVCDLDALATLPEREQRSGRGELAKYHFLTGDDLLALPLEERVAAAVRIKAAVVADDERERTDNRRGRAVLNYGHTLGHALETSGGYDLRHGEAVAIGLVYAAELARLLGRIDADRVDTHRAVLSAYDLPSALPPGTDADVLLSAMHRDKKALDGLTFVLDGPAGVEVVPAVDEEVARAALEAVR